MKIAGLKLILTVLGAAVFQVSAFAPISQETARGTPTLLLAAHNGGDSAKNGLATFAAGLALAGTIFASSLSIAPPEPAFAADYEISTGAIVINTSAKPGQSLLKAEVDAAELLKSAFKNRKALKQSVEKIANVVREELSGPAWSEIVRELLQTKGDVTPEIELNPPNDYQQLVKDLAGGRLNLIVNGELINLSIDEQSTTETDELVIRAKGIKGMRVMQPAQAIAKTRLQEQIEAFDSFWNGEFKIGDKAITTPQGITLTNGLVFGGGTASAVILSYVLSYAYYVSQQEQAAQEAEAKRQAVAAKKAAAAAKATKDEEE